MNKFSLFVLLVSASPAYAKPDPVVCKGEVTKSDSGKPVFADLVATHEDSQFQYLEAKIGDVEFEVKSSQGIFHYKPFIRTSDGQEVSGQGYFPADNTIMLDWTLPTKDGVKTAANLRCCWGCTFSDWPK